MGINQTISTPSTVEVWTEKSDCDLLVQCLWHRYQISARLTIPYSPEQIWQIFTHYEALPNFIPHLIKSQRLPILIMGFVSNK